VHVDLVGLVVPQGGAADVHFFYVAVVEGEVDAGEVGRVQHASQGLDPLQPRRARRLLHRERLLELVEVQQRLEVLRSPQVPELPLGLIPQFAAGFGKLRALPRLVPLRQEKLRPRNADDPRQVFPLPRQRALVSVHRLTAPF